MSNRRAEPRARKINDLASSEFSTPCGYAKELTLTGVSSQGRNSVHAIAMLVFYPRGDTPWTRELLRLHQAVFRYRPPASLKPADERGLVERARAAVRLYNLANNCATVIPNYGKRNDYTTTYGIESLVREAFAGTDIPMPTDTTSFQELMEQAIEVVDRSRSSLRDEVALAERQNPTPSPGAATDMAATRNQLRPTARPHRLHGKARPHSAWRCVAERRVTVREHAHRMMWETRAAACSRAPCASLPWWDRRLQRA